MSPELDIPSLGLFVLAVFPGLVSAAVYRLLMPARDMDWGTAVLQGLFYGTVNAALGLPVLLLVALGFDPIDHPWRWAFVAVWLLLLAPVLWPWLLTWFFRSKFAKRLQIPYPTGWDAFFDRREPCFILIHLSNGQMIGGYYGGKSYAGSYPNDGDIYLEAVIRVDERGCFQEAVPYTHGLHLRKEQYSYVEFFAIPEQENTDVGDAKQAG